MKIVLVKPPQTGSNLRRQMSAFEPLGLEYLSAWIKKFGFKATIIDAHVDRREIKQLDNSVFRVGMSLDNIRKRLIAESPAIMGVSCLFREYSYDVVDIVNLAKQILPDAYIILGGQDAATRPEFYFNFTKPDLIVFGEGELTLQDILQRLRDNETLNGIPGTIELKENKIFRNVERARIKDLDDLPFPERNLSFYLDTHIQKISFPFAKKTPAVIIQSSRGCVMKCAFCDIISVWKQWTSRSPKNIVDEIETLNKNYGVNEFCFIDDNFMLDKERVKNICREILDRKLNVSFEVYPGISVWTIDEGIITLLMRAGLYRICLPIESGSTRTLRFIGKPVDLNKTKAMIKYCIGLGLYTYGNIIIGFPFETKEEIKESIRWAFETDLDMVHFLLAEPYDGASMFSIYKNNGWIKLENKDRFEMRLFRTKFFDIQELNKMRNNAQLRYFLHKMLKILNPLAFRRIFWPKINSIAKFRYFTKILFLVFSGLAIPENFAFLKLIFKRKLLLRNYR